MLHCRVKNVSVCHWWATDSQKKSFKVGFNVLKMSLKLYREALFLTGSRRSQQVTRSRITHTIYSLRHTNTFWREFWDSRSSVGYWAGRSMYIVYHILTCRGLNHKWAVVRFGKVLLSPPFAARPRWRLHHKSHFTTVIQEKKSLTLLCNWNNSTLLFFLGFWQKNVKKKSHRLKITHSFLHWLEE